MHRSSNAPVGSSSSGPLRRNQACHQCRARKLKCDAGRPCSTCKRSHAKAIASLTSSGQAVSADPCCTYDYAPGEDPWTATLRSGLGIPPPKARSKSGSVSPGSSPSDAQDSQSKNTSSTSLPSSVPVAGLHRPRHVPSSRKRSPPYPSPGRTSPLVHDSVYEESPASLRTLSSPGAHDGFLSPPSSLIDVRGLPALAESSGLPCMAPYVPSHGALREFEYDEMAEMLYNPMGPFFDSPTLFSSLSSHVNPLSNGQYPNGEAPIYAHDTFGLDPGLLDPTSNMPFNFGSGIPVPEGDLGSPLSIGVLSSRRRGQTQ